jgi:hypothetical protein
MQIKAHELKGNDLGLLNLAPGDKDTLDRIKAQAMSRKMSEDLHWYGIDHQVVRDPRRNAYFGSAAHVTWSEAASLRTGGRLDAAWLRIFDPYGGCHGADGHGLKVLAEGIYRHVLLNIGMAHDTDWKLGRYFNAGPLESLYDSNLKQPDLGLYGLRHKL